MMAGLRQKLIVVLQAVVLRVEEVFAVEFDKREDDEEEVTHKLLTSKLLTPN